MIFVGKRQKGGNLRVRGQDRKIDKFTPYWTK